MSPVFTKITTFGRLPDGRIIEQSTSYPGEPATYMTYLIKDRHAVKAFGTDNVRTEGVTPDGLVRRVGVHAKGFRNDH